MKKVLLYSIIALLGVSLASCNQDKEIFDFEENPGVGATFSADQLRVSALTEDMGGKVSIPLYRANTKDAASVAVELQNGGTLFSLEKETCDFAAGEGVAYLNIHFDYNSLSAAPTQVVLSISNEGDVAMDGIGKTSFTLIRKLTYSSLGDGVFDSTLFGDTWDQEVQKAEEGDFYLLPSCYVRGYDISFFCDGESFELYTFDTGYNYDSTHGHLMMDPVLENCVVSPTKLKLYCVIYTQKTGYYFDEGFETITLPEGVTF